AQRPPQPEPRGIAGVARGAGRRIPGRRRRCGAAMKPEHNAGWAIILSFAVAFMLTAVPLPEWAASWRPAWVAMVLIYWCMALPERVGIGAAWCLGLLLDVQQGTLLGQHALGLALIAWLT